MARRPQVKRHNSTQFAHWHLRFQHRIISTTLQTYQGVDLYCFFSLQILTCCPSSMLHMALNNIPILFILKFLVQHLHLYDVLSFSVSSGDPTPPVQKTAPLLLGHINDSVKTKGLKQLSNLVMRPEGRDKKLIISSTDCGFVSTFAASTLTPKITPLIGLCYGPGITILRNLDTVRQP